MIYDPFPLRRCNHCGRDLLWSNFHRHRNRKGGLHGTCRDCRSQAKYPQLPPAPEGYKRCSVCQQVFLAEPSNFQQHRQHKDGLSSACKTCSNKQSKLHRHKNLDKKRKRQLQWQRANRDRVRQANRDWCRKNPGNVRARKEKRRNRAKQVEGSYTRSDVLVQYNRQHGCCYYCGEKLGKIYHVDHVIPISRGGANDPCNLVLTCPFCNLSKGDKLPSEWPQGGRLL